MSTTVSASDTPAQVLISENGAPGDKGLPGDNATGLNDIRKSLLDNPLLHIFKTNALTTAIAPTGTDADVTWLRATTATYIDRYGAVQTAAINTPREEVEGFLLEGASTNTCLNSEDISAWQLIGASASVDATTSPDGTTTADKIVEDSVNSTHESRMVDIDIVLSNDYVTSVFAKASGRDKIEIRDGIDGSNVGIFDLTVGVMVSGVGGMVQLSDDWFRCYVISTATSTTAGVRPRVLLNDGVGNTYLGDGVSGAFLWGGMIEELPLMSSYIPTTGSPATRSADAVSVAALNNAPLLSGDHSFIYKVKALGNIGNRQYIFNVNGFNRANILFSDNNSMLDYSDSNLTSVAVGDYSDSKIIASTLSADLTLTTYKDGSQASQVIVASSSSGAPSSFSLGDSGAGTLQLYGHIKDFRVYSFVLNADEVSFLS